MKLTIVVAVLTLLTVFVSLAAAQESHGKPIRGEAR